MRSTDEGRLCGDGGRSGHGSVGGEGLCQRPLQVHLQTESGLFSHPQSSCSSAYTLSDRIVPIRMEKHQYVPPLLQGMSVTAVRLFGIENALEIPI